MAPAVVQVRLCSVQRPLKIAIEKFRIFNLAGCNVYLSNIDKSGLSKITAAASCAREIMFSSKYTGVRSILSVLSDILDGKGWLLSGPLDNMCRVRLPAAARIVQGRGVPAVRPGLQMRAAVPVLLAVPARRHSWSARSNLRRCSLSGVFHNRITTACPHFGCLLSPVSGTDRSNSSRPRHS